MLQLYYITTKVVVKYSNMIKNPVTYYPYHGIFTLKCIEFQHFIPEFDTSKKRKNRKQAQKISILCGFFELFLLTNTENYDIIYLI